MTETGHALWAYSYVDHPTSRSLCPEQHARKQARSDWSVMVWKQPEGGDWVEVETERPDGSVS
jgi:hypothetical protein